MNRQLRRNRLATWLLLGWCVACNGGRSDLEDFADEAQANGGATPGTMARGGGGMGGQGGSLKTSAIGAHQWSGGSTMMGGTRVTGGTNATGGANARGGTSSSAPSVGGAGGAGGRSAGGGGGTSAGGTSTLGGVSGYAIGGTTPRGGAGGVSGIGGVSGAGAPPSNGGTSNLGGDSGSGGSTTGGMSGGGGTAAGGVSGSFGTATTAVAGQTGVAGAAPVVAGAGGTTAVVASGASGSGGVAASGGAAGCSPAPRTSTPGEAGNGNGTGEEWYVDAASGSDVSPGTEDAPLKTISCAASVAKTGDTVGLNDGTWDATNEPALSTARGGPCGSGGGIVFAPNVRVRAVNPGAARIVSSTHHGLCMSGGSLEGVVLACGANVPVLEVSRGSLIVVGTSFRRCGGDYGLVVSDVADVTLRPGDLTDYVEEASVLFFAKASGRSHLRVEGGKLTFGYYAIYAEESASVDLQGITLSGTARTVRATYGVQLAGAPTLRIGGGTNITSVLTGIFSDNFQGNITIDGLKLSDSSIAMQVKNQGGGAVPATVDINHLQAVDLSGGGVSLGGNSSLTIANSTFTRSGSALDLSGSGTATITDVTIADCWMGLFATSGRSIRARNLQVTGSYRSGVHIGSTTLVDYDFGTTEDPGNNLFRDNNTSGWELDANFAFSVPLMTINAIGNTWNANVQNADANGKYTVPSGVVFAPSSGSGPNYLSVGSNMGKLLLAESP